MGQAKFKRVESRHIATVRSTLGREYLGIANFKLGMVGGGREETIGDPLSPAVF